MKTVRAFIALTLPPPVTETLAAVSRELIPRVPDAAVRWVEPERVHLTLRFLGNAAVEQLDAIAVAIDKVAMAHKPFSLTLGRLGCFPNERRPRVIWVGLDGEVSALRSLKQTLDKALTPLGWEPEAKRFHAHLTLGRVKGRRGLRAVIEAVRRWRPDTATEEVDEMILYQSELAPGGAVHTPLARYPLGSGG